MGKKKLYTTADAHADSYLDVAEAHHDHLCNGWGDDIDWDASLEQASKEEA